jgi:hypothetical protein
MIQERKTELVAPGLDINFDLVYEVSIFEGKLFVIVRHIMLVNFKIHIFDLTPQATTLIFIHIFPLLVRATRITRFSVAATAALHLSAF